MKLTYALTALGLAIAAPLPALAATINAVMYKNPQCSCCEAYAAYLEKNGFKVDIVKKLLAERPAVTGITLAGMPAGAPGMGGRKDETWTVYAFTKDGKAPTVYATE